MSEREVEPEEHAVPPRAERIRAARCQVHAVADREREERRDRHLREVVALEEIPAHLEMEDLRLAWSGLEDDVALEAARVHPVVADRRHEGVREAVVELGREPLRAALEPAGEQLG